LEEVADRSPALADKRMSVEETVRVLEALMVLLSMTRVPVPEADSVVVEVYMLAHLAVLLPKK